MSLGALLLGLTLAGELPRRVPVGPGVYRPIYPASPGQSREPIAALTLDAVPVTNARYLEFVLANPRWQRGQPKAVFADAGYLQHWASPLEPGPALSERPVTFVSWFAARAYCAWAQGRLPTESEWEFAAAADEKQQDARRAPAFRERLLAWYGQPNRAQLPEVGRGKPNVWGVRDLHGLVWEWVLDFGNTMISTGPYCGAGSAGASEKEDYPSFMRIAYRSSLEARYTVGNLGFRCAGSTR